LRAMRRATSDTPIVFSTVADPVGQGFVSSLSHPGSNITGFAGAEFGLSTKILELLKRLAPNVDHVAILRDPAQPASAGKLAEIETAAPSFAMRVANISVRTADDIERSIAALAHESNGGIILEAGPSTSLYRERAVALALQHRLPLLGEFQYYVESGALASYGVDDNELSYRAASYVDRILRGERPRDLPVQLPTKFVFAINLKTAKSLGLTIPETLLATADEVSNNAPLEASHVLRKAPGSTMRLRRTT
jgi:putative ABC transport system substrate-binding protein